MWNRLGSVDQHSCVLLVSQIDNLLNRIHCSQCIGDMNHRHKLCPGAQQCAIRLHIELTVIQHGHYPDNGTRLAGNHLPGDDVCVVLHLGQDDLIRSEEHTSELQSRGHLVCRLLLEKKKDL